MWAVQRCSPWGWEGRRGAGAEHQHLAQASTTKASTARACMPFRPQNGAASAEHGANARPQLRSMAGKVFSAYNPKHVKPAPRPSLGPGALALFSLPAVLLVLWLLQGFISGLCSTGGAWSLFPPCLLAQTSKPTSTLVADKTKWRAFLRSAASLGPQEPGSVKALPGGSVDDAFPPDQWQPWELPAGLLQHFPNPESARLDPSLFHLHIKFLTFDRVNTTLRCLTSLLEAQYEGDAVSIEFFLDHPYHTVEGWRKANASVQEAALRKRREMLALLDSVEWPHGPKKVVARSLNGGIQPQWMEAFWPENVNEFAFIVEDDTEVSPFFYIYLKRLIMHYYYTKANFNPHVYGISFQRQWFVPAKNGRKLDPPEDPFLYQLVGTWGQIVFPIAWKDFRVWYDVSRYTPGLEPILDNMVTTIFWYKKGNSIWTHWQVHWAYVRHMFNLYTGFPGNLSLSVCHRTAGVNIRRTLGPDTAMITGAVLADPAYTTRDPATGLPTWWTYLPPARNMKLFDFCFRPLPNWRQPVTSLEQLRAVMPIFGAEKDLAVLPVPDSTAFVYKLLRNWLCHVDGTGLHNYMLLFTLHPVRDQAGNQCLGAAEHNLEMMEMAVDLAERNHLVYVQEELALAPSAPCIDASAAESLFLSRHQAALLQHVLDQGRNLLVMGVGAFWRVDPLDCFREAAARHRVSALGRLLKSPSSPEGGPDSYAGSVVWVEGSSKGSKKWQAFQKLWDKYSTPLTLGLPPSAAEEALKLLHGFAMQPPKSMSHKETKECVVAAPWSHKAGGSANVTGPPAIVLASLEETVGNLKGMDLWMLHDTYNACLGIRCTPFS